MESDEELARRLQDEFDMEALLMEKREREDAEMAQRLAVKKHQISDSEEEEEEGEDVKRRKLLEPEEEEEEEDDRSKKFFQLLEKEEIEEESRGRREEEERREKEEKEERGRRGEKNQEHTFSDEEGEERPQTSKQTEREKRKPMCKYGSHCYRKNPYHLEEFAHPHMERKSSGDGGTGDRGGGGGGEMENREVKQREVSPEKIPKKSNKQIMKAEQSFAARLQASTPYNLFLNKCYSAEETQKDPLSLVFPDLLNPSLGHLVESAQLTFMADLDFLMSQYKVWKVADKPILLAYGDMEGNKEDYPNLTCIKVRIPYQYGTHHTKAMLLLYDSGIRVVIHTANLVPNDWYEKTQGYWVSPLFPKLDGGKVGMLEGDSATYFKRDLMEYLLAYKCKEITRWANIIKSYDFTHCRAMLVGSVPGYHTGTQKNIWGHLKLRYLLTQHSSPAPTSPSQQRDKHSASAATPSKERRTTIIQCSSIGSLGKDSSVWLTSEFGHSLSTIKTATITTKHPKIKVIYPSECDVKESTEGWMGGSCLPYNSNTHEKQTWINQILCTWRSSSRGHTRSMPHIKTYTQVTSDHTRAYYFLLTSANLSRAAWGCLQKQGTQLFIRSYELGVLLLPKFVTSGTEFNLSPSNLTLPYDLPLTAYPPSASPWFMNTKKKQKDVFGRTYP